MKDFMAHNEPYDRVTRIVSQHRGDRMTTDFEPTAEAFEEIYQAVAETPRGRWFLDELAKRQEAANTAQVLAAIQTLQNSIEQRIPEPHLLQARIESALTSAPPADESANVSSVPASVHPHLNDSDFAEGERLLQDIKQLLEEDVSQDDVSEPISELQRRFA